MFFPHLPQDTVQKVYYLCKKVVCVSDKELDMALRIPLLVATSFRTLLTSFREEQLAEQDKILLVLSLTEVEVDVQCLLKMLSCL